MSNGKLFGKSTQIHQKLKAFPNITLDENASTMVDKLNKGPIIPYIEVYYVGFPTFDNYHLSSTQN